MSESDNRYRHEYKYMLNAKQEKILRVKAACVLRRDPHVLDEGYYIIRSAYFDDLNNSCLWDNIAGSDPRSKFRIRYYNSDIGRISLEKKSKIRGMCLKESCLITAEECERFICGEVPVITDDMPKVKKKFFTEILIRELKAKVIVTYERIPFIYAGGNVRVTFDRKITSSEEMSRFLSGGYISRPIMELGNSILEVKWDEVLPRHIRDTLQVEGLSWTAFSKYYMCRQFHL